MELLTEANEAGQAFVIVTHDDIARPGESIIVLGGALLGTAIITASFIVRDTFDHSIRDIARTELGPIDEVVRVNDMELLDDVANAVTASPVPNTAGILVMGRGQAAVAIRADAAGTRKAKPSANVFEVDFDDARAFGDDPNATGLGSAGRTPGPGQAAVGRQLANTLDVGPGDTVDLFL
ncbi:MAG: ABC-type lipoprotein release transport system permease subunit [Candidatus Poriferisodalaceae bacterium]|jgi:ABC-type lipoprotein release transport system permease subunit